ncbi:MAG: filamentous hemagglutinin N-terminal domain-containing protein [Cyanobacteria bacterium P01_H01_bin.130]
MIPGGAIAQVAPIVPDQTLPTPSQVSTPQPTTIDISGGTKAGGNLFHSFQAFTVPDGVTANFRVPTDVQRVLTRVSSGEPATVNGTLRVGGSADLFLLAPGGVFFGPNARLDVGGSFVASTADRMTFADGTTFDAIAQGAQPLLTSTVPLGLQFGRASSQGGGIVVTGNGRPDVSQTERVDGALLAADGQTFGLLGNSVTFQGGRIGAVGGQATLAAVGEGGSVTLAPNDLGWTIDNVTGPQGAITLAALSDIDVSGPGGGAIKAYADSLTLRGRSRMVADTIGALDGRRVELTVGTLGVYEGAYISSSTFGAGKGGDFLVNADIIDMAGPGPLQNVLLELFAQEIRNPAQSSGGLFALSFDTGNGGDMTVTANQATLRDSAFLDTSPFGAGGGGTLRVEITGELLMDGGQFCSASFGTGDSGNAFVTAGSIRLVGGGGIFASAFSDGDAGLLDVRAREGVEISGATSDGVFISAIVANAYPGSTGIGGTIILEAPTIRLDGGAAVASVNFDVGSGGAVTVRASELLELRGSGAELTNINTRNQGTGPAGNLLVEAGRIVLADGGTIFTSTLTSGEAGTLTVIADSIEASGSSPEGFPSGLRSDASRDATLEGSSAITGEAPLDPNRVGFGAAGDIDVRADRITLSNGAEIAVSNEEGGQRAGDLRLTSDRLTLNSGSTISAEPATGTGGNLFLNTQHLLLRDQSTISTNASGASTGGNIFIDTATLAALGNSDITANAIAGRGGQVSLSTQGIFGTALRAQDTEQSDITASSELGTAFSGNVSITTPEVDPTNSVVELPERVIDPASRVIKACAAAEGNSFVAIGRGGSPTDPTRFISPNSNWHDMRNWTQEEGGDRLATQSATSPEAQPELQRPQRSRPTEIQEATGWALDPNGMPQLIAHNAHYNSAPKLGDTHCLDASGEMISLLPSMSGQ